VNARYVLAKYVPDLNRMEPRNFGVFVWYRGSVACRMLSEAQVEFVNDRSTYERWVQHLSKQFRRDFLRMRGGAIVSRNDEAFIDAFRDTQAGNYLLVDGGFIAQRVRKREIEDVAEFLFGELVLPTVENRQKKRETALSSLQKLFDEAGLRDVVKKKFVVNLPLHGVEHPVRFTFGIGNGAPTALYQSTSIRSEASVHDAVFKLGTVIGKKLVRRDRCAAVVDSADVHAQSESALERLRFLENVAPVIDLADRESAVAQLAETAGL